LQVYWPRLPSQAPSFPFVDSHRASPGEPSDDNGAAGAIRDANAADWTNHLV
ncbi:hypothetical protein FRC08_017669, partial [Ceratobasidium sp. 394]